MGVVCGGAACAALGPLGLTAGLAGAALAAAVRALEGDSPASLAGSVVAPLVALAVMLDVGLDVPHASIAIAATAWTIAELGRGALATASPIVALLPAVIAAIAAPSCTVLLPIVGFHLLTAPWQRPRGIVAVPIVGCLAVIAAIAAGFGAFGDRWIGARHPLAAVALPDALGEALGPLLAVAALAGLALILTRFRHAQLAIAACLAGGLAVELRTGALDAATVTIVALAAGTAVGRLGALIRLPAGQAFAGATLGFLLVVPPAWTAVERAAQLIDSR
jgi:hypothetical protein